MFIQTTEKVMFNLDHVSMVEEQVFHDLSKSNVYLVITFIGGHQAQIDDWDMKRWNSMINQLQLVMNGKQMKLS